MDDDDELLAALMQQVADGDLEVSFDEISGERMFKITEQGKRRVEEQLLPEMRRNPKAAQRSSVWKKRRES
jgi:hypothetical protein